MLRVAASDPAAMALGLRAGLPLSEARVLVPGVRVRPLDPQGDRRAVLRLARMAEALTPLVALDGPLEGADAATRRTGDEASRAGRVPVGPARAARPDPNSDWRPDGLLLDITGCAHLAGGEAGLMDRAVALMAEAGHSSFAAIGPTPEAAHILARHAPGRIAEGGDPALLTLPVAALEASPDTIVALRRAGLVRIGDLAARPRAALAARFGPAFATRLARSLGEEDRRLTPLRPVPPVAVERRFFEPMTQADALDAVIAELAAEAERRLVERAEGGRAFDLTLVRADGVLRRLRVRTGAPVRDPAVVMRLMRLRIGALADPLDPGCGYDAVRLAVRLTAPLAARQDGLAPGDRGRPESEGLAALIDQLSARYGAENVLRAVPGDSHEPERASMWRPAQEVGPPPAPPRTPVRLGSPGPTADRAAPPHHGRADPAAMIHVARDRAPATPADPDTSRGEGERRDRSGALSLVAPGPGHRASRAVPPGARAETAPCDGRPVARPPVLAQDAAPSGLGSDGPARWGGDGSANPSADRAGPDRAAGARTGARPGPSAVWIDRTYGRPVPGGTDEPDPGWPAAPGHDPGAWPDPEPGQPPLRPLVLYPDPHPIDVISGVPDGPPVRFRWRRVLREVVAVEGPERIVAEWWHLGEPRGPARDYYRIEDAEGLRYWVFRAGLHGRTREPPRWFLHGLFA